MSRRGGTCLSLRRRLLPSSEERAMTISIDNLQGYRLGPAIAAFALPENARNREAETQEYLAAIAPATAPELIGDDEKIQERFATWQAAHPGSLWTQGHWAAQLQEDFDTRRKEHAAQACARKKELDHERPRGLLDALRSGAAVAYGRMGGVGCPKTEIPAGVWKRGMWEFQSRADVARGGAPLVSIYDITVFPAGQLDESKESPAVEVAAPVVPGLPSETPEPTPALQSAAEPAKPLSEAERDKLVGFILNLPSGVGLVKCQREAEQFLGKKIRRRELNGLRKDLGICGKPGRRQSVAAR
jgi:hypothetical protein